MKEEDNEKKKQEAELRLLKQQEEVQGLIKGADELRIDPGSDESLDKSIDKRFILEYDKVNPKEKFLAASIRPYVMKFIQAYYQHIFRLNGWPIPANGLISKKPGIVGKWTIFLIYLRFPQGTISTLRNLNPMNTKGDRMYKHFQFLTELGEDRLTLFIDDAVRIMGESKYWDQFVRKFSKEFGAAYQTHLFDKD